jgi:hypothetical protein
MSGLVQKMLGEQRRRLVGSLMTYLEQNVYDHLTPAEQQALRAKVLTSVGAYHDVTLDLVKSLDDGDMAVNKLALDAIAALHDDVKALGRTG